MRQKGSLEIYVENYGGLESLLYKKEKNYMIKFLYKLNFKINDHGDYDKYTIIFYL